MLQGRVGGDGFATTIAWAMLYAKILCEVLLLKLEHGSMSGS